MAGSSAIFSARCITISSISINTSVHFSWRPCPSIGIWLFVIRFVRSSFGHERNAQWSSLVSNKQLCTQSGMFFFIWFSQDVGLSRSFSFVPLGYLPQLPLNVTSSGLATESRSKMLIGFDRVFIRNKSEILLRNSEHAVHRQVSRFVSLLENTCRLHILSCIVFVSHPESLQRIGKASIEHSIVLVFYLRPDGIRRDRELFQAKDLFFRER